MKSLFKLVKSLHPSEKRYINLKLKSSKINSLLYSYFETIQYQKEYDFEALASKHTKSSPKVLKNSLRNLYANILKYLRSYNAQTDEEGALSDMLKDVRNLQEKSMLIEAEKLNKKLLKQSKLLEFFSYEKEALLNSWNLHHLRGALNQEFTNEIESSLLEATKREHEVFVIDSKYRQAVTLYYQYFFYERKEETKNQILNLMEPALISKPDSLLSSKAKMSSFEMKAMESIIKGDIKGHHNVRKSQLKLLMTAELFRKNYLSQLLVFSNLFTFLKSKKAIDIFQSYLDYMRFYYLPLIDKKTDGVLTEKYYDIYFQNQIYLQNWFLDKDLINRLLEEFKTVSKKEFKRNNLLVSRVYLSFAQLLILSGDYKRALQHLIEYQSLSLDKKNSTYFLDSELHLLMVYHLMNKREVFNKSVESIWRKNKTETIIFNTDQKILFNSFYSVNKNEEIKREDYEGRKGWLKVYLNVLSHTSMKEAVEVEFDKNKFENLPNEKDFLSWLYNHE
jgi:hypothetical protein